MTNDDGRARRFDLAIRGVSDLSLIGLDRLKRLHQFAEECRAIPGEVAEFGVYRGGSARLLAQTFAGTGKTLHLFDTCSGLPPGTPEDEGAFFPHTFSASEAEVRATLAGCRDFVLHVGLFQEMCHEVELTRFAFVHVDADLYESVKAACQFFAGSRLSPGGMIVFDDYGFLPGAKRAVDEYFHGMTADPGLLPTKQFAFRQPIR